MTRDAPIRLAPPSVAAGGTDAAAPPPPAPPAVANGDGRHVHEDPRDDHHVDPRVDDHEPHDDHDDHHDDQDDQDDDHTGRLIRPYAMTGGRTMGAGPEIPLEAQILASSEAIGRRGQYRWEAARLLEMVETPMALIEVAARLQVPVGVARVLVADLVADGSLIMHMPPPSSSSFTSLLEQVLDGVRDL